jgi:hypothetical protein
MRGARVYRRTRVTLYGQGTNTVPREQCRSREPYEAATDNQNWNIDFGHVDPGRGQPAAKNR